MCGSAPWSREADAGAAAPDGGGRRGGGLELPRYDGPMRLEPLSSGGLGGDLDEDCVGRGFVDLTGSPSGNAKVDLVAIPGRRPRNLVGLVAAWIETAWTGGSSTMTGSFPGNVEVDLVATSERVVCVCGVYPA